jgi:hypothetical protein
MRGRGVAGKAGAPTGWVAWPSSLDAARAGTGAWSGDPPWVDFDEGGLAGHLARCLRDLNQPQEAEPLAAKSIQLCRPTHLRTRVQRYAILASAHAQQGDLEGACAVGRQALAEVPRLRSRRALDDVARVVQLVGANDSQATHDFTDLAREVLRSR